ncbi:MAG: ferredoxin [Schwartzia sp.]|nr:ferredoxin [Schwartzia sp. (in: firmicutes)]
MKKLTIDQSKCNMCGACLMTGELLHETAEGKIEINGAGIINDDNLAAAESIAKDCPENALSLAEQTISVEEIRARIRQPLELAMPDKSQYSFNKDDYSLPILRGRGEYQYKYSSDEKAEREGLRDFRDNIYSQRKAIAQQVIISYKHEKLLAFMQYEEKEGNYKYDTIQMLIKQLKGYAEDLGAAMGGALALPSGFFEFQTKDRVVVKDVLKYSVDSGWAEQVASECEPYDWFDTWINSDDMVTGSKKSGWFSDDYEDVYSSCYKLDEASAKLNQQILDECQSNIQELAEQAVKSELTAFHEGLLKEWKEKTEKLLQAHIA